MTISSNRRSFLAGATAALAGCAARRSNAPANSAVVAAPVPTFTTDASALAAKWAAAVAGTHRNIVSLDRHPSPVLIEGGDYPGIWLECGPLESLVLPCYVWDRKNGNKIGAGQIQMVVPQVTFAPLCCSVVSTPKTRASTTSTRTTRSCASNTTR